MNKTLRTQIDDDVLTVWFDNTEKSTNTLSPAVLDELDELIGFIECDHDNQRHSGLIFTSAKPDVFISGADLFEMRKMNEAQMQHFLELGQGLFERIEKLPIPTVAAINGHCLGGGLELALACRRRVAADKGSINIGLPEIKLGIIPSWGGTTRTTQMLGPTRALPLLLTGKTMPPRKAQRAGLIDEVVRPTALLAAARRLLNGRNPQRRVSKMDRLIVATPPLRNMVCRTARRKTLAKTYGHYPAAERVIDVVQTACQANHDAALRAEREAVTHLAQSDTCRNLMRLFFLRHDSKRSMLKELNSDTSSSDINHAAVIGGGTMGAGIVHALIRSALSVRLIDLDEKAISTALRRVRKLLDDDVKAKRLSVLEAQQAMHRVSPTCQFSGLKPVDFVIEAVAEKIEIKRQVFEKLDQLVRPDAILASNTSSLSITDLAMATDNPARVIGLHFFNPVPKMPLVEVIRTPHSADSALAAGVKLSFQLGKTPILVADAPGFLVNRVLIPYLAEALIMASEGVSVSEIDAVMKAWGMPMGPFELLDQVGLDVAMHIMHSLSGKLDPPIPVPDGIDQIVERGWLGRKSGRGFYDYRKPRRPRLNQELITLLSASIDQSKIENRKSKIEDRLLFPMINEAARLLTIGVTDSTDTIDLATVLGLGLAPFRGGLVRFAESTGLAKIVDHMDELAHQHGPRFVPADALRRVAQMDMPMQAITRNGEDALESGTEPSVIADVSGSHMA